MSQRSQGRLSKRGLSRREFLRRGATLAATSFAGASFAPLFQNIALPSEAEAEEFPVQLLFKEPGPGILKPLEGGPADKKSADGVELAITHEVTYYIEDVSVDHTLAECAKRIYNVFDHSQGFPAAGIFFQRVPEPTLADVVIGFYESLISGSGFRTITLRGGPPHFRIKFIDGPFAFNFHEKLLHEGCHLFRMYHMGEAWPDYPYKGVSTPRTTEGDQWLSLHDRRGLRAYKHGVGRTSP